MKTARGSLRRQPAPVRANSQKLPDLMRQIQTAGQAGRWKVKTILAIKLLTLYRRRLWVGEDPDRPNLLLIVGPGGQLGKIIGFHLPMDRAARSGLLTLVGQLNDPRFKP